jgi:carboxypeptidase C (cathepsin A)
MRETAQNERTNAAVPALQRLAGKKTPWRCPMLSVMQHPLAILVLTSLALGAPCFAEPPESVITRHQLHLSGATLNYTAEAGRIAIRDVETGAPHGYMFYTAYRVASPDTVRPVTFIWNGGPGADSTLLHFSVAGPKLIRNGQLTDNAQSWLAASDLVMVDPIGTGFSRPVRDEYAPEFYSTRGDVASVTEFVRCWRVIHGAENAPVFLVGESWGAGRAASVGYALESRGIRVNGLVLISGGWALNNEFGSPDLRDALRVVDMASAALFYKKTAPDLGQDMLEVRRAADSWVRGTYAPALARISSLSDEERASLASELARFTGIPADKIDHATLHISPGQFRRTLLASENKQPNIFDLRISDSRDTGQVTGPLLRYFREELKYRTDLPYIGLEPLTLGFAPTGTYPEGVGERWNYATKTPTSEELKAAMEAAMRDGNGPPRIGPRLPATAEAIAINPHMKVLVAAGMYDGFQPCASGQETEAELPADLRDKIRFKCYQGGHALYQDEPARLEFSHDVKTLIGESH